MKARQVKGAGIYALSLLIAVWTCLIATAVMAQASPTNSSVVVCINRDGSMTRIAPSARCRSGSERVVLGATGPVGATGSPGISKAYISNTSYSPPTAVANASFPFTVLHTATIDAGTYIVTMIVKIDTGSNYNLT